MKSARIFTERGDPLSSLKLKRGQDHADIYSISADSSES